MVVRVDSIGSIMIALWEKKNSGTKVRSCLSEFCLGLDYEKKRFLSIESPGLTVASTDYGHTKAKSPILCSPNSYPTPK